MAGLMTAEELLNKLDRHVDWTISVGIIRMYEAAIRADQARRDAGIAHRLCFFKVAAEIERQIKEN